METAIAIAIPLPFLLAAAAFMTDRRKRPLLGIMANRMAAASLATARSVRWWLTWYREHVERLDAEYQSGREGEM